MDEFNYTLQTPIEYAVKGQTEQATFVKLLPPTSKQLQHCAALKQAFMRATQDFKSNDKEQSSDSEDITGEQVIAAMYISSVDMPKLLLHAIELLTCGVAMVEGDTKLTKPIMDNISQTDLENMTGEYLVNFTLSSLLK